MTTGMFLVHTAMNITQHSLLSLVSIVHGVMLTFWLLYRWYKNSWSKNCVIIIIIFNVIPHMEVTCPLALSANQKL
jgi:hypothetical protein